MSVLSLLGLLAKIMCSICSFQCNIWNAAHWAASILNWFLNLGHGIGACLILATGWPGIALHPGFGPLPPRGKSLNTKIGEIMSSLCLSVCRAVCPSVCLSLSPSLSLSEQNFIVSFSRLLLSLQFHSLYIGRSLDGTGVCTVAPLIPPASAPGW